MAGYLRFHCGSLRTRVHSLEGKSTAYNMNGNIKRITRICPVPTDSLGENRKRRYSGSLSVGSSTKTLTAGAAVAIGIGAGIAIGSATGNLAAWTAIGAGIGVALASMLSRSKPKPT